MNNQEFDPYEDALRSERTAMVVVPMDRGPRTVGADFIRANHYTKSCAHQQQGVYGLYYNDPLPDHSNLLGVLMFSVPGSEAVRECVFGKEYKDSVTGLHRLFIADETPINTESWFIANVFRLHRQLRPDHKAVISYSDPSAGHAGIIYQATNARQAGKSKGSGKLQFQTPEGAFRHGRQCGHNVTIEEATERGWTVQRVGDKWRYLFLLPQDKREAAVLKGRVTLSTEVSTSNGKVIARGWEELGQIAYPKQLTMNGNPTFRAGK